MSSSFTAFIVEDDPAIIHSLRSTLNKLGCEVRVSKGATSENFQEEMNNQKIDAAFVSLTLRGTSGRAIARHIKANFPFSKIFLMTSWQGELDGDILNAEGLAGVIRKPLRFSEVKKTLIEHLG